ncbi:hypothetical protein JAB1_21650 [Janthinobacterium sp. MP5059B]|nr:hypothetical protein JAB1_21650 [Janthinobacterium sp. MP5059B]
MVSTFASANGCCFGSSSRKDRRVKLACVPTGKVKISASSVPPSFSVTGGVAYTLIPRGSSKREPSVHVLHSGVVAWYRLGAV